MTTRIRSDFLIQHAAPPQGDKHRSNPVIGKAAYRPRLPRKHGLTGRYPTLRTDLFRPPEGAQMRLF